MSGWPDLFDVPVLVGLALGLSLAAPPGPMNALIARESSQRGFASGLRVGLGAPVADVLFLVVFLLGLGEALDRPWVVRVAAVFGAGLMAYFALDTWRGRRGVEAADRPATFTAGLAAALTNPYQIVWWLTAGVVFLHTQGIPGVAGLVAGIFGWVFAFAWLMAHGAARWSWFAPTVAVASALLLGGFSVLLGLVALGVVAVD